MIYVVDLDDTLISSTALNNDSYNFALEQYNYTRILTRERITREKLNHIKDATLKKIIKLKQFYFTRKWLPYRVILNKTLIEKLKNNGKENCYLWTKADKKRANKMINLCGLDLYFNDVIFDKKENFKISTLKLKKITKSSQFVIYENDESFFNGQNCRVIDSVKNYYFDIKGYLVK